MVCVLTLYYLIQVSLQILSEGHRYLKKPQVYPLRRCTTFTTTGMANWSESMSRSIPPTDFHNSLASSPVANGGPKNPRMDPFDEYFFKEILLPDEKPSIAS